MRVEETLSVTEKHASLVVPGRSPGLSACGPTRLDFSPYIGRYLSQGEWTRKFVTWRMPVMMMKCSVGVCCVASLPSLGTRKARSSTPTLDPAHGERHPFVTCPEHDHAQQAPTKQRSSRAGDSIQQPGTVRPHRKSPGGEVCPDTALNCSLTGVRSSNQSTLAHAAGIDYHRP